MEWLLTAIAVAILVQPVGSWLVKLVVAVTLLLVVLVFASQS